VDLVLGKAGLRYDLTVNVRHPLDVLVNDVGLDAVALAAKRALNGLQVAPYYGCQIVRPERGFDDREFPTTMDRLFERLGASCVYFPHKTRCCGTMLMTTFPDVALKLVGEILESAIANGAHCVITTCPMCQVNLEAYQKRLARKFGIAHDIPVLYFTQLLGVAFGCSEKELGLKRNLVPLNAPLAELVSSPAR